jgi:anti-sigma factor ChrR (cupin superfamily)
MTDRSKHGALPPDLAGLIAAELTPVALSPERRAALGQQLMQRCASPGTAVLRADEGEWIQFVPGIRVKTLRFDAQAKTQTTLWRLDPGARVPRHPHQQHEECLVLEGSILHAGQEYHVGDFLLASPGSRHRPFDSPRGALLLIRGEPVPKLGRLAQLAVRLLRL